jgi:tryptophanyl-tRNA synthetase
MSSSAILTGVRVNSTPHLGNYIGGILPMVNLLNQLPSDNEFFYFVPDLHSFTTPVDFADLKPNIYFNLKTLIAAGFDANKPNVTIYRQSRVPAHSELAWILSCFATFGETSKMTQFKDKSRIKGESVSVGLFTYPILMAADILLYGANYIPVGDDQTQHLEFARDIAIRFNNKFKDQFPDGVFVLPKPMSEQNLFTGRLEGVRIRSLQNPESKMSKSVEDPRGTILLNDKVEDIVKKIMSAQTDSVGNINWNWTNQPGITNLLQIQAFLNGQSKEEIVAIWQGQVRYGDLKKAVAESTAKFMTEFQDKFEQIKDEQIDTLLLKGESKANQIANQTLLRVQKCVGLK